MNKMKIELVGGDAIIDTYMAICRQAGINKIPDQDNSETWSTRINALFRASFGSFSIIGSMVVGQLTDHLRGESLIWYHEVDIPSY